MLLNEKQICYAIGGEQRVEGIDPSQLLRGITWDSRDVKPGEVFCAFCGEVCNGHDFIDVALQKGAKCIIVMEPLSQKTLTLAREMGAGIIEVPDTKKAFVDLARAWRAHLKCRVIGITGSCGKTTTKNLIRDVLATQYRVCATQGNQNNELGVPKTLLSANPDTEYLVVEMGMQGIGEIAELCDLAKPDWGVISNVGESHIELLGSRENIACAKSELFANLPQSRGVAFCNALDDYSDFVLARADVAARGIETVWFGAEKPHAVWADDVALDDAGCPHFVLNTSQGDALPIELVLRGLHNVSNACSAAAVGLRAGVSLEHIAEALAHALPEQGRQEVLAGRGGYTIINDAYNANPESMRASLLTFSQTRCAGRRYAVLGDMGELGSFGPSCHRAIGELVATLPIDYVICIGELAALIGQEALAHGKPQREIMFASSISEVLGELDVRLSVGDSVLVKASHFMGLSRVVEGLVR